ncbi:hypothetical protein ACRYJJ_00680 [Cylindrospermopsis raciborskii G7]|uniref:hypothetical protein n=1 Tax=Cylindrospermopsis raciborskii TaxID=77022 RepID=UPI003EB9335F
MGERTRREVDTALSEIATAYAAEQLISSRLFASSLTNLSKEVKGDRFLSKSQCNTLCKR